MTCSNVTVFSMKNKEKIPLTPCGYLVNLVGLLHFRNCTVRKVVGGGEVIWAMPERKHSFLEEVFPYIIVADNPDMYLLSQDVAALRSMS